MLYVWHGEQTEREVQAICCAKIRLLSVFQFPDRYKIDKKYLPAPSSAEPAHFRTQHNFPLSVQRSQKKKKKEKNPRRRVNWQDAARLNGYLMWIKHYKICGCSCPNQDSWCLTKANRGGMKVFCVLRWGHLTTVCCYYLLKEGPFPLKNRS